VRGDGAFDVLGEVVPQVPAVGDLDRGRGGRGDLDRGRSGLGGRLRVGAGAVAADDLDPRAVVQMRRDGFGWSGAGGWTRCWSRW
jgi:hypothetical protein